ncbi:MAG: hypothetical protein JXM68_13185 [Sedimentisphaerales bacterium]|nr:hypothetical protein [Sedimentisphaerales bacterium]
MQNFQGGTGQTGYVLSQYGSAPGASVVSGTIRMLSGVGNQRNVIAFNRSDIGKYSRIVAQWDMNIGSGADGYNFSLLNTASYGVSGARGDISYEEEPVLTNSFSVAFDIYCPDDYQRLGSHEISLHLNGVERANKHCSLDYRESNRHVNLEIDFVAGGAEITLAVGGTVVYDKYFLAGLFPYESRVAFGARTGGIATSLNLDNINVVYTEPVTQVEAPVVVRTFDKKFVNMNYRDVSQNFNFPPAGQVYERVVMKFTVEEPANGWDPWDRLMNISIWDGGTRYEIARFMTPYSKAGTWYVDVTDYQIFLNGNRKMSMFCDTWINEENKGYLFTTEFEFYKGNPTRKVIGIQNLWVGTPMYGDLNDQTMSGFFTDKSITIPSNATGSKLRFMVTGHGQRPNADNAAEFLVRSRTVTVNGSSYSNILWKNDCYLNPCRPQGGTWTYSRAGWAPGDMVTPWEIDISNKAAAGSVAAIDYTAEPFYNATPDWGNVSRHWVESQIVFYQDIYAPAMMLDLAMDDNAGMQVSDSSGNGFNGEMTNMDSSTAWTTGAKCGALTFDGINDYVEIPGFKGIPGSGPRSCSAWIKTNKAGGQIIGWGDNVATGTRWVVRVNATGTLRVEIYNGYLFGNTVISDGKWHHVAVVLPDDGSPDVTEALLYVDGVRDTIAGQLSARVNTNANNTVKLGVHLPLSANYFSGQIDDARIYSRALSQSEIIAMYNEVAMAADFNNDGIVNIADFATLSQHWLSQYNDLNCDGIVDITDLSLMANWWLSVR